MRMNNNKNLVAHRRILCEFREIKEFQCEACLMLFSHEKNMKKHQKKACKGKPLDPPSLQPQPGRPLTSVGAQDELSQTQPGRPVTSVGAQYELSQTQPGKTQPGRPLTSVGAHDELSQTQPGRPLTSVGAQDELSQTQPGRPVTSRVVHDEPNQTQDMKDRGIEQSLHENQIPLSSRSSTKTFSFAQENNGSVFSANAVDQDLSMQPKTINTGSWSDNHILTGRKTGYNPEALIPFNLNHRTPQSRFDSDLANSEHDRMALPFQIGYQQGILNATHSEQNTFSSSLGHYPEATEAFGGLVPGIFQTFPPPSFPEEEPLNKGTRSRAEQTNKEPENMNTEQENRSGYLPSSSFQENDSSSVEATEQKIDKKEVEKNDFVMKDIKKEPPMELSEDEVKAKGRHFVASTVHV